MDHCNAHGGTLVNLYVEGRALDNEKEKAKSNRSWDLSDKQMLDIELLLNGAYSPLAGYLSEEDYNAVVDGMRLSDGTLWPMPINLDVTREFADETSIGDEITLRDPEGVVIANLTVTDLWTPDRELEARQIFGTTDDAHPGVQYLLNQSNPVYLGGTLVGVTPPLHYDFERYRKSPQQLRETFHSNGWNNVIAFQTRNPIHKAHVIMMKRLMARHQANLVIHTAVGKTKTGDIDHFCRVRCYEKILPHFPEGSIDISILPLAMRFAGPREALWQAIIRQNYGFTHFIVGRDHAGPGRNNRGGMFYDALEAQELVSSFQSELNIQVLKAPFLRYVEQRSEFVEEHELLSGEAGLYISGGELKQKLVKGEEVPDWFAFPEVVQELNRTLPPRAKQGFTLFFTGLSGSGKSTLANGVMVKLRELGGRNISLLDGDVVRKNLSSELTFSKEHRDLNIQRIGYVASEISKNGGIAVCAPIAPYTRTRRIVRDMIEAVGVFVEIHVATPIEVCESRDRKGLYAMARAGKIKGFTGIDDPYEVPENPEMSIDTSQYSMTDAVDQVVSRLRELGLID
ncbi:bifunctional sulfate adenylyltransferase/adenylylsulfate kinase [Pseudomaricurvus alkylphenolicus]|uniref:bifunctional sulfate adenylyltransferase/adenylylsulfate kinase n=1 Tax=Pseudomaricurvus alkylphenolicus TaxID=1306991 RepID=UPI00141F0BDA|nr:bifunctional sulfate adenylyltransferase/adenylylsulfate kinase [Pseudomaricurvus alkylphenolicus]NIB37954.1 bifunctional sulfate adenylyltransferase/adenylylsulfate kinase [Pseudomaricurvus alkylphenolicus]